MNAGRRILFTGGILGGMLLMQGCISWEEGSDAGHPLEGVWRMQDQDLDEVRTYQIEFLRDGKLKGFVEIGKDTGDGYVLVSRDTLGDSSRYEADALVPGWVRILMDVHGRGGRCACLHETWDRYEVFPDRLRFTGVEAFEGASTTLVGTWHREQYFKEPGTGDLRVIFAQEFAVNDTLTRRLIYPPGDFRDTLTFVNVYKDSGTFFSLPGTYRSRHYYRIISGRLFYYQNEPSDSLSVILDRVED